MNDYAGRPAVLTADQVSAMLAAVPSTEGGVDGLRRALALRLMAVEGLRSGCRPRAGGEPAALTFVGKMGEETVVLSDATADLVDACLAATSGEELLPEMMEGDAYNLVQVAAQRAGIGRVSSHALRNTVRGQRLRLGDGRGVAHGVGEVTA